MEREPEFFLTLILHHGGKFLKDDKNVLEYVGGEIDIWEGLDVDTMCLWTPSDLCKEHGYVRFDNIWWHNPDFNLEKGLRPLAEDLDVRQMCNIGMVRDWEMHIYFEHPIDTPKISQKAPNDATIDDDLRRTVDDILRMTMTLDFVEDDASEDTEVVLQVADQSHVEEAENEFRDSGIEVDGSAEEGAECDGAAGADLIDTNAEDIADFEGVVGAANIDTSVKKITECDGAARVDNTVAEDEELNDAEVAAGADMGEDDRGKGSNEEDRTYEASEESSGENMAAGEEEDAAAGEEHTADGEEANGTDLQKVIVNVMQNVQLPPQTVVRPPPVRPSGLVMPTASRIPGVGLLRRSMPRFNPLSELLLQHLQFHLDHQCTQFHHQ
ncbi:hypothetical protein SESBI_03478 [Sesbania bispinosa]|nr:hypothetical protein SESBI_03478 [Sesbania bispinosa]